MEIVFDAVSLMHTDGTLALDAMSLEIPSGQICVVLGPSGAGKSTLLRCVNALAVPTEGRILIGDTPLDRRSTRSLRPNIGMVHQDFALVPRASVAANIIAGAIPATPLWRVMTGAYRQHHRRRAVALAAAVGLDERHLARRADRLSGGQQQRVGIARACMLSPPILLADEPVASLDPATSLDIMTLLCAQARATGATLLCSLHQIDLARRFADRILVLDKGRIAFDGDPAKLDVARLPVAPRLAAA